MLCSEGSNEKDELMEHEMDHSKWRFFCPKCNKTFASLGDLCRHIAKYHSENVRVGNTGCQVHMTNNHIKPYMVETLVPCMLYRRSTKLRLGQTTPRSWWTPARRTSLSAPNETKPLL